MFGLLFGSSLTGSLFRRVFGSRTERAYFAFERQDRSDYGQ